MLDKDAELDGRVASLENLTSGMATKVEEQDTEELKGMISDMKSKLLDKDADGSFYRGEQPESLPGQVAALKEMIQQLS